MTAKNKIPAGYGFAFYTNNDGQAIFANPSASQLPTDRQAALLREASRAMAAEAERLQRRR